MTKQEVFDKVVAGLAAQGFQKSQTVDGMNCMYRSEVGERKCAAGHLIADEFYRDTLEFKTTNHEAVVDALVKSGVPVELTKFGGILWNLQKAHDRANNSTCMMRNLREVAEAENLTIPAALSTEMV